MRRYETIFITDPDISEQDRSGIFEKTSATITGMNGFLAGIDEWGAKKMAYPIKRKNRGYYVRLDYCGDGALVDELERTFRIDDRVLRFLTILLDENVDLEELKQHLAEIDAAKKAETEQQAQTETKTGDVKPTDIDRKNEDGTDSGDTETVKTEEE